MLELRSVSKSNKRRGYGNDLIDLDITSDRSMVQSFGSNKKWQLTERLAKATGGMGGKARGY